MHESCETETRLNRRCAVSAQPLGYGQGKHTTTILEDQGSYLKVINDIPYRARTQSGVLSNCGPTLPGLRLNRPMHRTTLSIESQPTTDYVTSVKYDFGGSKTLSPVKRLEQFPSQGRSQIYFGNSNPDIRDTSYSCNFYKKDTDVYFRLHYPTFVNKVNMNKGSGMKQVMTTTDDQPNYWTHYGRIHNRVGAMLGSGVPHHYPVRQRVDIFTGELMGPAWKENNHRISGNLVLNKGYRNSASKQFILG